MKAKIECTEWNGKFLWTVDLDKGIVELAYNGVPATSADDCRQHACNWLRQHMPGVEIEDGQG